MRVNLFVRTVLYCTVLYCTVLYCTVPAGADTPHGVVHGGLVQDLAPEHGLGWAGCSAASLRHKLTFSFSSVRAAGGSWASRDEPVSWTRPRFLHISFF